LRRHDHGNKESQKHGSAPRRRCRSLVDAALVGLDDE
jgi:hypothetical protein